MFSLRSSKMEKSNYSFLEKLLHKIILGSNYWTEFCFDLEKTFNSKKMDNFDLISPVYITGLARSGTTAMLEMLNQNKDLLSLSYQEMPFVLATNTIGKVLNNKNRNLSFKERSHKDGIYINVESPEALEEVFWKMILKKDYIKKDSLLINNLNSKHLNAYKIFIRNFLSSKNGLSKRYLAKNNNQILRLPFLLNFTQAKVIIMYRNPLQHALALLNQHKHFSLLQSEDHFVLNYMNWIGHYEFGLKNKFFDLGNDKTNQILKTKSKSDINYWLFVWLNYYQYSITLNCNQIYFLSYEEFCQNKQEVYSKLKTFLDLETDIEVDNGFDLKKRVTEGVDEELLSKCNDLYHQLSVL